MRAALLLLVGLLQASGGASGAPERESTLQAVLSERTSSGIELWDLKRWREPLLKLYAARAFVPLWFSGAQLTPAGVELLTQLGEVDHRGLLRSDYDAARLALRVRELVAAPVSGDAVQRLDAALSVTAARLVYDLHRGRVRPAQVGYDLDIPQPAFDVAAAVARLAIASNVEQALDELEPPFLHYSLLKSALAKYRELAAQRPALTDLPPLPRSKVLALEDYRGAENLRALLTAVGDLPAQSSAKAGQSTLMTAELVTALTRFQSRHGLDADGVLGRATLRALTTPLSVRVQQIVLSLERARWLPAELGSPPIIVNVPQFRLFAFRTTQDFAQDILQMDVIVGAEFAGRRTPVFAADMTYVVLKPYWDVPRSILVKELLPGIEVNPGWVAANGFEIVRGASDEAKPLPASERNVELLAQGKLRLRQKPGPENALGRVKFMLPNRHAVYLHDTPARDLFKQSRRAFSHGCIRVADPVALLAHVLREDSSWSPERIEQAFNGPAATRIPLPRKIPVFIIYGTALATEAGETLFFDDIYAQDAKLTRLLAGRARRASVQGTSN
jgi:L,D-transpeptidase YcbB